MNEAAGAAVAPASPASPSTAGRLLREARERQGLHIAALAAAIKVTQKKLEALEADRFEDLPDATFTRALAQTVCRALKIDSAGIMRLLPPPAGHRLEQVGEGLNAPFRARPGALVQRDMGAFLRNPAFWLTVLVLLAALAVYLVPGGFAGLAMPGRAASAAASPAAASTAAGPARAELPGMPPDTKPEEGGPVPVPANLVTASDAEAASSSAAAASSAAASAPLPAAPIAAGAVQVQTTSASWVEITDARGQPLVARLVKPGEAVEVDGSAPFKVRIGNAAGTRLTFRGQPVELAAATRDNVARLELK